MTEPEKFKLRDVFWSLILPLLVGILIIALPTLIGPGAKHLFGEESPIPIILTFGFAQMLDGLEPDDNVVTCSRKILLNCVEHSVVYFGM